MNYQQTIEGCAILVRECACVLENDHCLVISDDETSEIGELILEQCSQITKNLTHHTIPAMTMHGEEPPGAVAQCMLESTVIFCLTRFSLAHSAARKFASQNGARILSLPDYSAEFLSSKSLRVPFAEFLGVSQLVAEWFTRTEEVFLTSEKGSKLTFSISGRKGNAAPGFCFQDGILASPPDIESNISIVEDSTNGTLVVDGSIPHPQLGLLKGSIIFTLENGLVTDITGNGSGRVRSIFEKDGNHTSRVAAELGVGLNPQASLSGHMLEDEGVLGTIHIGFGSNAGLGGQNESNFHLDCIVRDCSVRLDSEYLMENGIPNFEIPITGK